MARAGRSLSLLFHPLNLLRRCAPHTAKAAIICEETGIAIAGTFALADGRTAHVRARLPRTATHNALHVLPRIGRPHWISRRTLLVISRAINVLAPFGN